MVNSYLEVILLKDIGHTDANIVNLFKIYHLRNDYDGN